MQTLQKTQRSQRLSVLTKLATLTLGGAVPVEPRWVPASELEQHEQLEHEEQVEHEGHVEYEGQVEQGNCNLEEDSQMEEEAQESDHNEEEAEDEDEEEEEEEEMVNDLLNKSLGTDADKREAERKVKA